MYPKRQPYTYSDFRENKLLINASKRPLNRQTLNAIPQEPMISQKSFFYRLVKKELPSFYLKRQLNIFLGFREIGR